jgi:hypothetical protein
MRQRIDHLPEEDVQAINDMFSIALGDARRNVDISLSHPAFYRRLLADPQLRQAFLDGLDDLAPPHPLDEDSLPAGLTQRARPIADILREARASQPTRETASTGAWQLRWERTREYLQTLLLSPAPATNGATYRRDDASALDEEAVTVIMEEVQVDDLSAQLLLEVARRPETPHLLHPILSLTSEEAMAPQQLQVTLQWGPYRETSPLDAAGRANLPPIPAAGITDDAGSVVDARLEVILEPLPPDDH